MIQIISGVKGKGKTKFLIQKVNDAEKYPDEQVRLAVSAVRVFCILSLNYHKNFNKKLQNKIKKTL